MHHYNKKYNVYIFAAIASMLLSIWAPLRETVINADGICYLLSAQEVGIGGIKAAMHLCGQAKWPFYSALIYWFSNLTHTSLMFSAYFLNGVFSLLSVILFMLIIAELGGSRTVLWFAALTILLAHDFNSVRQYIVRDHGFFASYLFSILIMLRYFRDPTWLKALAWSISIIIATIFRIEGIVFLALAPILILFCSRYRCMQRLYYYFQLNFLTILLAGLAVVWLTQSHHTVAQLGRLDEVLITIKQSISSIEWRWVFTRDGMVKILDPAAASQANLLLFLMVTSDYIIRLLSTLSLIYALLVAYALIMRVVLWTRPKTLVVLGYLIINLMITIIFYAQHYFLSKRYLIALSLVLMCWVPYALDKMWRKLHRKHYTVAFCVSMFWVLLASLGGIFDFGYSKAYIYDAGQWIAEHVSKDSKIYTNSGQLMYYSQHFDTSLFDELEEFKKTNILADKKWRKYNYVAIVAKDENELKLIHDLNKLGLKRIKRFDNKRGDRVVVFKI